MLGGRSLSGHGLLTRLLDDARLRDASGIGNNIWHPTAIPWLADRFSERKGLVMAFHSMGGNIGDAIAPLVIGFLLQSYNWRTVVLMNVVPGIKKPGRPIARCNGADGGREQHLHSLDRV